MKEITSLKDNLENKQPSNIEAEQALLGSILVNNDIIDEISNTIVPSIFFDPAHVKIFEVIQNLNNKGMIANPITLKNYFEKDNILLDMSEEEYNNIIWDPFSEMLRDPNLHILHKPEESRLETIWYNVYRDNKCWHQPHTHPSSTFSGIYLLHLEGENGTVFSQLGHHLFQQNYDTSERTEGEVIIFPSSLQHTVASFGDHKVSISFNIISRNSSYGNIF